jgi:carbamoyl-phosphate synthase large subunit
MIQTIPEAVRAMRASGKCLPVYKIVDTCAAEFEASTPYYYSTYEKNYTKDGKPVVEDEIHLTDKPKVIIIGGGPNRIGQGIEFDYCCVQAAFAMRELGLESVMINSNPETVSTDYDTSDLLFFEPLTHEDILNICERLNGGPFTNSRDATRRASDAGVEDPKSKTQNLVKGVIVQFGGQTPLNLARGLKEAGVPILGTTVESIDAAGDREQFRELLQKLGLRQPENGIARRGQSRRPADWLSRTRASQFCARRAGDGDRLYRGAAQLLHDARRRCFDGGGRADPGG